MSSTKQTIRDFANLYPYEMDSGLPYWFLMWNGFTERYKTLKECCDIHSQPDIIINATILTHNLDLVSDTLTNISNINESQDFDATQKQLIIRELLDKLENELK